MQRVGNASQPDDIIGYYKEEQKNTNGVGMLKVLENDEKKRRWTIEHKSQRRSGHGLGNAEKRESAPFLIIWWCSKELVRKRK